MTNKLHTSQKTQEIFNSLGQSLRLQPFILSKLAIALSVRKGQLQANDFKTHLDRGAKLLEDEKRYSKDFYNHLCHLDDNI